MDELQSRLDRLAPAEVDVDGALAGVRAAGRRRRVRRRGTAAAAMVAVVAVLLSAVALTGGGGDDAAVVAADPDGSATAEHGTDTSAPPEVPTSISPGTAVAPDPASADASPPGAAPPPGPTVPGVVGPTDDPGTQHPTGALLPEASSPLAAPSDIEVVITPEQPSVAVGQRVRARVDVTNRSSEPALLDSGGCGPIGITMSGPNGESGHPPVPWDGATPIAAFVQGHDVASRPGPTYPNVGSGMQFCTADLRIDPLAPGATTTGTYVFDAVVVPGRPGAPAPVSITAGVNVITGSADLRTVERRSQTATVAVTDQPGAHQSPATFLAEVEASAIVQQWLQQHPVLTGELLYEVTLSFANGGFELWVDNRNTRLRVRGDVQTGEITEIRSVISSQAPSDDPDAVPLDGPDEILFTA